MESKAARLFSQQNLVYVATVMRDGSPQVSPVWADLQDGHIMVNTAEGRTKHKNVLRDPRVAVSVVSRDDPLDMAAVRGVVVELIPDYEYKHADQLTKQYMNKDRYPFKKAGERRVILKIRPDHVFVMPKLVPA